MKRIIRNLTGVLLLSLAIVVTQIPVEQMQAAESASDFQLDGTTLVKYTGTASAVSVPDEVKKIGEEAFNGNSAITSIRLPKGLESIGYGAFGSCTSLKTVQLPDSVTSVGGGAFAGCTSLGTVSLGAGVKELGTGVFAGCTSLKSIKVNKGNASFKVEKGVLYDSDMTKLYQYCPGKTESLYTMPATVREVVKYAFWGCENLETVVLNNDISMISGYAFSNCSSLKEIQVPYSVKTIGAKAFEDCIGLTDVELPPSVRDIHETAFDGCINLTLSGEEGSVAGDFAKNFNQREKTTQAEYEDIQEIMNPHQESTNQPEPETSLPVESEKTQLPEQADITTGQEDVGNLLGSGFIVGNQAVVFIDNSAGTGYNGVAAGDVSENMQAGASVAVYGPEGSEVQNGEEQEELLVPEAALESDGKGIRIPKYTWTLDGIVADQAYYKRQDLTSFNIPQGTKEIGEFSFARTGLTSITIPEGVTRIGYGAFYHCDGLNQVTLPSTIEEIEPEAFEKTGFIENWKKSGSSTFLTAGDGILLAYNGADTTVQIPDGVKIIAPGVFKDHEEIDTVILPDSLVTVGEGAFEGCTSLKQVTGGTLVKKIKDRAFAGCPLDTIRIPDQVEEIGLRAYDFTGMMKENGEKTIVFHGAVPGISYEKTAQRLSNPEYRGEALEEIAVAVINQEIPMESLESTVLDGTLNGFKGIIISITSDTDMTASVRGTTLTGEELAYFEVPSVVEIYGRQYTLSGAEQLESMAAANEDTNFHNEGSVLILNRVADMETSRIHASLSGNTGSYYLSVSRSDDALTRLSEAYFSIFGKDIPANLKAFDLSLLEEESGVPITRLGKQSVRITMPVPNGLENGSLFILCNDANGQLEDVPYQYEETENGRSITFETNHFSDFGFYTTGSSVYAEAAVSQGKVTIGAYSVKDDSPDTGDSIHPKWFLAGGLLFAAIAVFFYRRKPRDLYRK